jgi:HEPN domain-containing protein
MPGDKQKLVAAWLAKAESDLATARLLIQGSEKHLDTGVYHCQQAGEKALKAWLTHSDTPFQKTHDLEALLARCMGTDASFSEFEAHAGELTPFASEFRYPGDLLEPSLEDAQRAQRMAAELVAHVRKQLEL